METFELISRLQRAGKRAAMATLVRTKGTTPRKEGTKMFVDEDGRILGSVTIGGCVDARVIEEASEVLMTGAPRLLDLQLGDEEAWDIGLTCGGTVEVFVEPLDLSDPTDAAAQMYEAALEEAKAGRGAALATVIGGTGRLPVPAGTRIFVGADGSVRGSLGKELTDLLVRDAPCLIRSQATSRTLSYPLSGERVAEVFIELFGPAPALLIFGGGAVAIPLVTIAKGLGFRTVIVDGRPRFANRERFPDADEIRVGIPSEIAEQIVLGQATWVVLVAHDYKYDVPVLRRALEADVPYIGMLGSRRRGRAILDLLREQGVDEEKLGRVRVPIGLDIGAQTAAEIALSILAEILAVKYGREGSLLSPASLRSGLTCGE